MSTLDWQSVLDIDLAIANCRTDIFGDWHRDPWAWPELEWLGTDAGMPLVIERLNSRGVRRSRPIDVAKENFLTRPAVVFDPLDRLIFQALVDRSSAKLIGDMDPWVFSWRLSRRKAKSGRYTDNGDEWKSYRNSMSNLSDRFDLGLATDIVSFFESVPIESLCEEVAVELGAGLVTERLVDLVHSWSGIVGRKGLPQRSWGSSVLANFYLRPVDDVLRRKGSFYLRKPARGRRIRHYGITRWVDDIWIFATREERLRATQLALQDGMRELGLHLHAGKTMVYEGEELQKAAKDLQRSAIDNELRDAPATTDELDALIAEILANPTSVSQTLVRLATVRMRSHRVFDRVDDFVEVAPAMPHCSQHLARLFRDSGKWRELEGWFIDYAQGDWAQISWAVAQLGTMFPSGSKNGQGTPSTIVQEFFAEVLAGDKTVKCGASPSLTALLAQRVSQWDPPAARNILREQAPEADHPMDRRVLALAGLNAGERRAWASGVLSEFEENRVTQTFLQERRYRSVRPAADFEGH